MTQQPAPDRPAAGAITPEPGSRLEQLRDLYPILKAEADNAAEKLKAVVDGIKVELTTAAPGASHVYLAGTADAPALGLTYSESKRFDSTRFKRDQPGLYDSYLKASGSWRLAPIKGGE